MYPSRVLSNDRSEHTTWESLHGSTLSQQCAGRRACVPARVGESRSGSHPQAPAATRSKSRARASHAASEMNDSATTQAQSACLIPCTTG